MRTSSLAKSIASFALAVFVAAVAGCTCPTSGGTAADPCKHVKYGGKAMEPYVDTAHKFAICVPTGLTKATPSGYTDGRVVFSGFAVPAGTNLVSKTFVIVAGAYPDVQGATAFGQFVAGGVTFQRTKFYDGSAGHMDLHVTYTAVVNGQALHLDFDHHAVNPGVYPPGSQPAVYNEAAQIALTEVIVGTFRKTP